MLYSSHAPGLKMGRWSQPFWDHGCRYPGGFLFWTEELVALKGRGSWTQDFGPDALFPVFRMLKMEPSVSEAKPQGLASQPSGYLLHKASLFILGGIIVQAKFTKAGSELEAVDVPLQDVPR